MVAAEDAAIAMDIVSNCACAGLQLNHMMQQADLDQDGFIDFEVPLYVFAYLNALAFLNACCLCHNFRTCAGIQKNYGIIKVVVCSALRLPEDSRTWDHAFVL